MKKSLFLVGDGNTGKSQLKSLVERLLGKGNHIGIDLKEIEARFGTGAVYGTRLAGSSDMSFLTVDELETFKKVREGGKADEIKSAIEGFTQRVYDVFGKIYKQQAEAQGAQGAQGPQAGTTNDDGSINTEGEVH